MTRHAFLNSLRRASIGIVAVALAACATPSRQAGEAAVDTLIAARLPSAMTPARADVDAATLDARVGEMLAEPLTVESAVRIALLKNPRVQAEYARLGVARGDLIEASRLSNPRLSWLRTRFHGEPGHGFTGTLTQRFTELLLLPARTRLADAEYLRQQQEIGSALLDLAVDVESAWFEAVSAIQVAAMRDAVANAAKLSAKLAQRFFDAGNLPRLELLMAQAAASQAQIDASRAHAARVAARSKLATLLGVRSAGDWRLPDRLAAPLPLTATAAELLPLAQQQRLDLAAAGRELAMRSDALRLARNWRFLGDIELGAEREKDTDGTHIHGLEASIELPIFQQGQAAIARAEAERETAQARWDELTLAVDNEVALAIDHLEALTEIAEEYRSTLLPQHEGIVAGTQRELNFMFKGAFELLLVKQQEYAAYQDYLEAVRDYWIARAELKRAVGGRLPDDDVTPEPTIGVEAILPQAEEPSAHEHHQGM